MRKLTIGITVWNNFPTVLDNVDKLLKIKNIDLEILLYVQEMTSSSPQALKWAELAAEHSHISVHQSPINTGQSVSRNWIMQHASGEYLLFLDADITLIPGSVEAMLAYMENHPQLLGLHYDVKGDVYEREKATTYEVGLTDMDMEPQPLLMFHYAIYRTSEIRKFPLPEFEPFGEPGWGVEEDVAHLNNPLAHTDMIRHRRFWHHPEGRSQNFLGKDKFVASRAKRWCAWQLLKHRPRHLVVDQLQQTEAPAIMELDSLFLSPPNKLDLVTSAAQDMFLKFFPFSFVACSETNASLLMWDHDRTLVKEHYGGNLPPNIVCCPDRMSPLWLLAACKPLVNTWESQEWLTNKLVDEHSAGSVDGYLSRLAREKVASVSTGNQYLHLMNSLLNVPSTLINAWEHQKFLAEHGLKAKMTYPMCSAFRALHQQTMLSRVIAPLTHMIVTHQQLS